MSEAVTHEEAPVESENERVDSWRLEALLHAGYPVPFALELSCRHDIDLHKAVELLANGCDPQTAAAILL